MSRRGNVFDNAAMESWNSKLKSELGERFEDNDAAKREVVEYIEDSTTRSVATRLCAT